MFVLLSAVALLFAACSSGADNGNGGSSDNGAETAAPSVASSKDAPEAQTNEPVTLKWLMIGPGKQQDADKVWEEFNRRLQSYLPNTSVEFEVITLEEYAEKWKLIAAAGEQVDIAWTGWLIPYVDEVNNGAYRALDELIDEYAPDIKDAIPAWLLDVARVDGTLYSIPHYQVSTDIRYGLRIPSKLSAYIDAEAAQAAFYQYGADSQEALAVIEQYLQQAKDNGQLQKGPSLTMMEFFLTNHDTIVDPFVLDEDYSNPTVLNKYASAKAKRLYDTMRDWFQKGLVRQDILSLQNPRQDEGLEDGYIAWTHSIVGDAAATDSASYGFPIDVIPMQEHYKISRLQSSTSTTIPRSAKHPERAMQLLNLMHTEKGKDLYNLLVWGLEGEHYNKTSDKRIETIGYAGQGDSNAKYGLWKWAVGNVFLSYETQTDAEGYMDMIEGYHAGAIISPLMGFKPDTEDVQTELAQIRAVAAEFHNSLLSGAIPDHEQRYEEFMAKLETAGSVKVQEELQRQVDEYLANQ